jgi:hypothetical protein
MMRDGGSQVRGVVGQPHLTDLVSYGVVAELHG